jgi:hypothetical protein
VANCAYCGISIRPKKEWGRPFAQHTPHDETKDHLYPLTLIRGNEYEHPAIRYGRLNELPACRRCNDYKGRLHPLDWLVIMPDSTCAARIGERMIKMGEDMDEVFAALRRRKRP